MPAPVPPAAPGMGAREASARGAFPGRACCWGLPSRCLTARLFDTTLSGSECRSFVRFLVRWAFGPRVPQGGRRDSIASAHQVPSPAPALGASSLLDPAFLGRRGALRVQAHAARPRDACRCRAGRLTDSVAVRRALVALGLPGQGEPEGAAFPQLAHDSDSSPVRLDQRLGDG